MSLQLAINIGIQTAIRDLTMSAGNARAPFGDSPRGREGRVEIIQALIPAIDDVLAYAVRTSPSGQLQGPKGRS